ncbi:MAG: GTP 3',8-cyclase MoaA [Candidatus Omnitrophica bacterium]|nr:GTP 3',8-cyclase MoaA [Candidatus Omnitrophota bacterium]MCA9407101.1 GTP 3',8-cyclase MoaA [Candidatus Omnitrophota bacterium]
MHKKKLIDSHGRVIHKLRVQITDACNFRCFYCMPQQAQFTPSQELLSYSEIIDICSNLVDFGIDEMRVSGGEPTLRKDFCDIIRGLSKLPVERLGVTTNGFFLKDILPELKDSKCQHINVSLDSLDQDTFRKITKTEYFDKAFKSIVMAKKMDFHVKVNIVILRGINDHELFDFIKFSAQYGVEVRFLELMKIGPYHKNHSQLFVPAQELIERIEDKELLEPQSVNCDSTSFNFHTSSGAKIGFIASESQPFCGFCSRLRLTATGKLRACIMSEAGMNLRGVNKELYPEILQSVLGMKPTDRIDHIKQPMYQIGG